MQPTVSVEGQVVHIFGIVGHTVSGDLMLHKQHEDKCAGWLGAHGTGFMRKVVGRFGQRLTPELGIDTDQ